ncbi:uncharacterized protein LOC115981073 [Quercus lobata]|uniref:uncharacterized protein LOC115981073 n=1 Tax=Quercus lobata TaxID=97700 RepID=UPI0012450C46|nr:uncharacterized protein LOC115981073 [Quercus lobata]
MVWRIGNGASIRIKENKWLLDQCYRTVISPLPNIPPDAKVSSLINSTSCAWKFDVIHQNFLLHEAKIILSIPLSFRLPSDCLIWSKTPSGLFIAQSAYKLLACDASTNNTSSSNPNPQKSFWRGLWMLWIPSKMRHFVWRACNEAMSTMVNLFRCHIANTDRCMVCNAQPEDFLHAVWGCEALENVWSQLSWARSSVVIPPGDFSNLFAHFLQVADALAKKAKEGEDFKVWSEDISRDIAPLVASDVP